MNKGIREKKVGLHNWWYYQDGLQKVQPMNFQDTDSSWTQKGVQRVSKKRKLWSTKGLNLECPKPKCFNCQVAADCKTCVKGHKCDLCKASRQHSSLICSKTQKCDLCVLREKQCQYINKKYCATCAVNKGKCAECEDLPPKCNTNTKLNPKLVNLITNFDFELLCKAFTLCSVWFQGSKMWYWGVD